MKEYKFKINGKSYDVAINSVEGGIAEVRVNGKDYSVEIEGSSSDTVPAAVTKKTSAAAPQDQAVKAAAPVTAAAGRKINSPLPGVMISINVKEGQSVKRGEKVAVIEAMKMENDILAECDGVVTDIRVSKGDSVLEGATILTIA